MAARKRLRLALKTRERIRTSMLINRLQDHVFGRCERTPTQVRSALVVLRKTLPDLKAHQGRVLRRTKRYRRNLRELLLGELLPHFAADYQRLKALCRPMRR